MSVAEDLLRRQNADGGWSYSRGGSWTEPTCYALLGLRAAGAGDTSETRHAAAWLARCQRADGGFAPRESVRESTWLAGLVLLLPENSLQQIDREKAVRWLLAQSGRESGWVFRLRVLLTGTRVQESFAYDGWPWYPDAAAWIGPTALSVLALESVNRKRDAAHQPRDEEIDARAERGRDFLFARRCRDDGWNHGSTRALGYDSDSYPEMTGLALLALHGAASGAKAADIERGIARAEALLARCQSSEAASWLTLGLCAHGQAALVPKMTPKIEPHRTTMELALSALAAAALAGNNVFLAA